MDDFNELGGDNNLAGLTLIEFVPIENVASIDPPKDFELLSSGDIDLTDVDDYYQMYGTIETMEAGYEQVSGEHGESYSLRVAAFIPKLTWANDYNFEQMRDQKFIVIANDQEGARRLFGSVDSPMYFSISASSGASITDRAGTNITFYGASDHVPWYVRPA